MNDQERPSDGTHPESTPGHFSEVEFDKGPTPPASPDKVMRTGQPAGLWVLFITEMWERFSYYGMRALLVLYLAHTTMKMAAGAEGDDPGQGFGWTQANASILYGVYTFMVYFTSIFGGIAADRFLGTHRSMLVGGYTIALGHICLALTVLFGIPEGSVVSPTIGGGALGMFMLGLTFIIIGTGFFKPCVSVMVGQLYGENDDRRDSGFTIFYMGINLGAFLSPLVAGTLGQKVGWHYGFGAAAVGMILGLTFYQIFRPKYLKGIGDAPERNWAAKDIAKFVGIAGALSAIPIVPLVLYMTGNIQFVADWWGAIVGVLGVYGTATAIAAILLGLIGGFLALQLPGERGRLAVILILALVGNIFFWTAFEQAGSSMNFFAANSTDLHIFGFEFPSTWYQSVNALTIVICAPFFSLLWIWLAKRKRNPSTPMKFAIGLWLLGLSFIAMVLGSIDARDGLAGPHWLLITYIVYTWGELCLSPVGLSMVTKLAPKRLQSLMMGLWFMSLALSNLLAGLIAAFSTKFVPDTTTGTDAEMTFIMPGLPGFYLMLVIFPIGAGIFIALISPVLRKMMRGIH